MPKPKRSGAETGDVAARPERRLVDLGAPKRLEPVAFGIAEGNQPAHAPRIGQCRRLCRHLDARRFQLRRQRIERSGVRHFPAEEARAFAHRAVDHDPLLAVVHPEGQQRIAALDRLEADEAGAEFPPVVERIRSKPGISQTQQCHARLLVPGR